MFNPFLKGQVSFKCGGGLIYIYFFFLSTFVLFLTSKWGQSQGHVCVCLSCCTRALHTEAGFGVHWWVWWAPSPPHSLTEQPPAGQRCHPAWDTPRSRDTSKKPNWFSLLENTFEINITSSLARNKCFLSDPGKTEVPKFEWNLFPVFLRHKEYQKGRAETQEGKRRTQGVIWPWFQHK